MCICLLESALTLTTGYLLGLLLAARSLSPHAPSQEDHTVRAGPRLAVIVPAHDEEDGIAATLESLGSCAGAERARVIVIADNCSDRTAGRASAAAAEVWERNDPGNRGKGFALAWAFDRLLDLDESFEGVVVVDADCTVSPNLLDAVSSRLRAGAHAVQVDYLAGNPEASSVSALRFAAFAVGDTVRFRGKEALGLSCGLVGTGMAFSSDLLRRVPWTATGLVEDGEYHMRMVLAGERAEFVSEASVSQAVPTSMEASAGQQARWEMGKAQLVRGWLAPLVFAGLKRRDPVRLHAGLECLIPPQSVIAIGSMGSFAAGLVLRSRHLLALSLMTALAQSAFVLAGLRLVRAPAFVYRALLTAPVLIAGKLALYARMLRGRGPTSWVRTEREVDPPLAPLATER